MERRSETALLELLAASSDVAVDDRVAVFDNDGTMWCEKPNYVQLEFMLAELARAIAADPSLAEREECRALIERDATLQAELGLECIALALVELCAGIGPIEFDDRVRAFFAEGIHRDRKVPYRSLRYVPMLELVEAPTSSTCSSSPAAHRVRPGDLTGLLRRRTGGCRRHARHLPVRP